MCSVLKFIYIISQYGYFSIVDLLTGHHITSLRFYSEIIKSETSKRLNWIRRSLRNDNDNDKADSGKVNL